jgi:hypothetical protein
MVAVLRSSGAPLGVLVAAAALSYPVALLAFRALRPGDIGELLRLRGGGRGDGRT